MLHTIAVIPTMTPAMTAVFAFQLTGWAYHPPDGDQTCLGYLVIGQSTSMIDTEVTTHGIFPPLE